MTNTSITFLYEFNVKPASRQDFDQVLRELKQSVQNEPGTRTYECYGIPESDSLCLIEQYADSDAVLAHMDTFSKNYAERFMSCLDLTRITMLGTPNEALSEMVAPMFSGVTDGAPALHYTGR